MENYDLIDPEYVIRESSKLCGDGELNHGFFHGWYLSQIRQCLDELAFKVYFNKDLEVNVPIEPVSMQMIMPEGIWDIQRMFAWSGAQFIPETSVKLYHKTEFNNSQGGGNYTASRNDNNGAIKTDVFGPDFENNFPLGGVYYYNIMNGILMLSRSCATYERVKIVYTGTYGPVCEVKCIPRIFFQVIKYWIKKEYHITEIAQGTNPTAAASLQIANDVLYNQRTGAWWEAAKRSYMMTMKERNDQQEYANRGNW